MVFLVSVKLCYPPLFNNVSILKIRYLIIHKKQYFICFTLNWRETPRNTNECKILLLLIFFMYLCTRINNNTI